MSGLEIRPGPYSLSTAIPLDSQRTALPYHYSVYLQYFRSWAGPGLLANTDVVVITIPHESTLFKDELTLGSAGLQ